MDKTKFVFQVSASALAAAIKKAGVADPMLRSGDEVSSAIIFLAASHGMDKIKTPLFGGQGVGSKTIRPGDSVEVAIELPEDPKLLIEAVKEVKRLQDVIGQEAEK